jgi:hypothetical protein
VKESFIVQFQKSQYTDEGTEFRRGLSSVSSSVGWELQWDERMPYTTLLCGSNNNKKGCLTNEKMTAMCLMTIAVIDRLIVLSGVWRALEQFLPILMLDPRVME